MGIFSKFLDKQKQTSNSEYENEKANDIEYTSQSSGKKVVVNFENDIVEILGKRLAKVKIEYIDLNSSGEVTVLGGNEYLVDPSITRNEDGEEINTTREYYQNLFNTNRGLCKGFFREEDVQNSKTNYLGMLDYDSQSGKYTGNRYRDENFECRYEELLKEKAKQKEFSLREDLKKSTVAENQINSGYQNMCDNNDKYYDQRKNEGIEK